MTMLDRMRQHKNWLKWSLGLVCLTFIIFYIPSFLQNQAGAALGDRVVRVGDRVISTADFRRRYQMQLDAFRAAYGAKMTEDEIRRIGIDQQVLQQLIEENAELAEAARLGVSVSDEEIRARLLAMPELQDNGRFIGEQRYRDLLRMQRPPLTPTEFEDNVRRGVTIEKLRAALTEWMSISDPELEKEYRRRNEKVKLAVVAIPSVNFRKAVTVTDADVAARFEANKEQYRVPETRKIRYVQFSTADLRGKLTVPKADVEQYYNDHIGEFSSPEEIRVSHILLKTEGKTEADVRTAAEGVLKQAREGADFAELAKKYSEDETTSQKGGDLDYFGRGTMVPEFEGAAFALQPGQISDLVQTPYGFHIIKLVDKRGGVTRQITDPAVYKEISDIVSFDLAERQGIEAADALARAGSKPADIEQAAKTRGLKVEESAYFARGQAIDTLGMQPDVVTQAFELQDNVTSGPVGIPGSRLIFWVSGKRDSHLPTLEEARDKIREDITETRTVDLARKKAEEIATVLKNAPDFDRTSKAAGFEPATTESLTRESVIAGIGISPEVDAAAFSQSVGSVSGAIATGQGAAIIKVLERQDVTSADFAAAKESFRGELLVERRGRFYSAYMAKAKQNLQIDIDAEAVKRALGTGL